MQAVKCYWGKEKRPKHDDLIVFSCSEVRSCQMAKVVYPCVENASMYKEDYFYIRDPDGEQKKFHTDSDNWEKVFFFFWADFTSQKNLHPTNDDIPIPQPSDIDVKTL